jgi:hypothetical protein
VAAIYDTHGNLPPLCGLGPDPAGGVDCLMRVPGDVRFGIRSSEHPLLEKLIVSLYDLSNKFER